MRNSVQLYRRSASHYSRYLNSMTIYSKIGALKF